MDENPALHHIIQGMVHRKQDPRKPIRPNSKYLNSNFAILITSPSPLDHWLKVFQISPLLSIWIHPDSAHRMPLQVLSAFLTLGDRKREALCNVLLPPQIHLFMVNICISPVEQWLHVFKCKGNVTKRGCLLSSWFARTAAQLMAYWANLPTKEGYTHGTLTLGRSSVCTPMFMKHEATCHKNLMHINETMQSNYFAC